MLNSPDYSLVVEKDVIFRASIVRYLRKIKSLEVLEAANLKEARELITVFDFKLLVIDADPIDVPELSAFIGELSRDENFRKIKLIILSENENYSSILSDLKGMESAFLKKPLSLAELVKRAEELLSTSREELPFTVFDFIQLANINNYSISISFLQEGRNIGEIIICKGKLWSVYAGEKEGIEALRYLLFSVQADIEIKPIPPEELGEPNIKEENSEALLLDLARVFDEENRELSKSYNLEDFEDGKKLSYEDLRSLFSDEFLLEGSNFSSEFPSFEERNSSNSSDSFASYSASSLSSFSEGSNFSDDSDEPEGSIDELLNRVSEEILNKNYQRAYKILKKVEKLAPDHPIIAHNLEVISKHIFFDEDDYPSEKDYSSETEEPKVVKKES